MKHARLLFIGLLILISLSAGCIIGGLWAQHIPDRNSTIDSFGKTHFIVGYPHTELPISEKIQEADEPVSEEKHTTYAVDELVACLTCADGHLKQAFFSPDDNIEKLLTALIDHEQESIKIAIFSFTNAAIAQALIRACERKIAIEMIVDASCIKDRFNKLELLKTEGIKPYVYYPTSNALINDIMHNKFVIFKKNVGQKSLLWTGSFNFTKSAQMKNQENVVILDDTHIIDRFEKQFELIKNRVNTPKSTVHKVTQNKKRRGSKRKHLVA